MMYINVLLSFLTILFLVSSQKIEGVESESKTDLLRGFWQSMKFKDNQINVKEFISLFWDEEGVEIGENASKFLAKSFKQLSDDNWVTEDEFVDFYGGPYEGFFPVLPYEPVEVHVNIVRDDEEKLGGNDVEDQMRVFFVTKEALDDSFIEYHTSSSQDPVRVSCDMYTYEVPKNWWNVFTGQIYAAIISLDSIPTSSSLFYKVGGTAPDSGREHVSSVYSIQTPPPPDTNTRSIVYGDQGTFMPLGFAITEKILKMEEEDDLTYDFIHHVGDIAYAGLSSNMPRLNITNDDEFEHIWDLYFMQNEPLASSHLYIPGVGNHEKFYDYTSYKARFWNNQERFYYSFNYGNTHWISLSSEIDYYVGSDQYNFFEDDLKSVDRSQTPWVIVTFHRPIYCTDAGQYDSHSPGGALQTTLEPLMREYGVDVTFTGHMHCYERVHDVENGDVKTFPIPLIDDTDTYLNPTGPIHVVVGSAGAMQFERWVHPQPVWSSTRFANGMDATRGADHEHIVDIQNQIEQDPTLLDGVTYTDTFGFGIVNYMNSTHLHFEWVPVTGELKDEFWIVKNTRD